MCRVLTATFRHRQVSDPPPPGSSNSHLWPAVPCKRTRAGGRTISPSMQNPRRDKGQVMEARVRVDSGTPNTVTITGELDLAGVLLLQRVLSPLPDGGDLV